jgi:CheY-like chemotaxis protein
MHILLIDDSASTRSLLRTLINSGQTVRHDISEAASGEEALQKVELGEISLPEVIIMDVNMGGMSGYDLCREFRKRHSGSSSLVPYIIIVTANEGVDVIRQVLDAGANDYMPKPVNVKILHVRLLVAERLISHARTNDSPAQQNGLAAPTGDGTLGPREALITTAFEHSEAPMAVVEAAGLDPSFRILYTNESMGFTTKFTTEQLVGKSLADLEAWTTEFIDMVVGFVSRGALLSYVPMWTRTRQDFQVYLSFYPIRQGEDDPITHYLVIHHL